ncbi:MAG: DNA-directed RNA polymerase subunit RpoH/Rpb5 C-terminal domain-containing protein [Candidatus Micrarchaeia archaeon]
MVANIEHILVPSHELLTEDKAREILKNMNLTKEDLPKIKESDPAIQNLKEKGQNVKPGDIIKISRKDPPFQSKKYDYYRLVIKG